MGCQKWTGAKLNNLVSPAYAWYWRLTGDETERQHGDDLFSNMTKAIRTRLKNGRGLLLELGFRRLARREETSKLGLAVVPN